MKKVISIVCIASICILSMEACKKSTELTKEGLTKAILGRWRANTVSTTVNNDPPTPKVVKYTDCYIFKSDTGINKIDGADTFVYKVISGNSIQINTKENATIKINGSNMHFERSFVSGGSEYKTIINFTRDDNGYLYETLNGLWDVVAGGAPNDIFLFSTDDRGGAVNYSLGTDVKASLRYKPISLTQFMIEDKTDGDKKVDVTIIDADNIKLTIAPINNPNNKKEVTLKIKNR